MNRGYIKLCRSKETEELLKSPSCFMLLTLIAYRAKRTDDFSVHNLQPGEALIGDYGACGLTEQQYRTTKEKLEKWGFATFKPTNKGTIARLTNTKIYDINQEISNGQKNEPATDKQRTSNGQITTNKKLRSKECKKDKKNTSTHRTSDKRSLNRGARVDISDSVQIKKLKKEPGKGWNKLILRYCNRFGFYPIWAKGRGSTQEFVALDGVLKKLDGDMERLLEYFELFLNDENDFLMRNGHRPSLINKLLDGYTRSLTHGKETKYNDVPGHIRIG